MEILQTFVWIITGFWSAYYVIAVLAIIKEEGRFIPTTHGIIISAVLLAASAAFYL